MAQSEFVGVDGCTGGWVSVGLSAGGDPELEKFTTFGDLLDHYAAARLILVDMPIGLPTGERGGQIGGNLGELGGRRCDWEAREFLGRRWQRVFLTPTRRTVYTAKESERQGMDREARYEVARQLELDTSGAELDRDTSFNLVDQIHQVDILLPLQTPTPKVREVHPEICFWALNGRRPMPRKHGTRGIERRIDALREVWCRTDEILEKSYPEVFRKSYGSDDVLDALVAAVTAYQVSLNPDQRRTLPADPPTDAKGLPMEMVYWIPPEEG